MPDSKHLKILKKGVSTWNSWRKKFPEVRPNLRKADLSRIDLSPDIQAVDLGVINLRNSNLSEAKLVGADLLGADLEDANLCSTNLNDAILTVATLRGANLSEAKLVLADLSGADLTSANLAKTCLNRANLNDATLTQADLSEAILFKTVFGNVNLKAAKGLNTCIHHGPSTIDFGTFEKSDILPDEFLRGCGLSNWEIESTKLCNPGLTLNEFADVQKQILTLRGKNLAQKHKVFISYSHKDGDFVDALELKLNEANIRFWRDTHDAVAGRLDKNVEFGIRSNPIVIVVLSKNAIESDWVEHEVKNATKLKKEIKRDVLCPIRIDDEWKKCDWDAKLRTQIEKYNILDFRRWEKTDELDKVFQKLIQGFDLFYPSR